MSKKNKEDQTSKKTIDSEKSELKDNISEIDQEIEISSEEVIKDLEEKVLRAQAEMQNVRRASQNEITKVRLYGSEILVKDFLPSIDNLFRTLDHQDKKNNAVPAEGISLILRELLAALEKNGVFVIDPKDEEFNPEEHEAISVAESADVKPNICLEVVQKGYKFKDRIIRPAMVVVTKK
ncbi:nucleotide exchange factor GrpE [SAR86 cluster bacterium]|jgi:molecular chaperone GrpE|nr:nucleotide exchange factor GrpE [SAR86 cluster bacterium]